MRARRLAGMEQRILGALERRLGLERGVERLDHALPCRKSPSRSRRRAPAPPAARRRGGRRARSRRARCRDAPASTLRRAASTRLGKSRVRSAVKLDRDRLGQLPRRVVVRPQARRVRLGEPEADERVLDAPAQLLVARERAEHRAARGSVNGTSSSRKRATSSTTSISRVTSRARHVGATTAAPSRSKPSRAEQRVLLAPAVSRCRSPRRRAPAGTRSPAAPAASRGRRRAPSSVAPVSSSRSDVARFAAGSARYGSTPFSQRFEPSVRSRWRSEVRKMPVRLEVRGLEQHRRRRLADLGLLAAHDPGERDRALGVGDHQVVGDELAVDAVERAQPLARVRRGARRSGPPWSVVKSKACSGLPSASIT